MANYWKRNTNKLIVRYKNLLGKEDFPEQTKKEIETVLISKVKAKTDIIKEKYCKDNKKRKNYLDGINKNLLEILNQDFHYLSEKLDEISTWRPVDFHYRKEIEEWNYQECIYDWESTIKVVREWNKILFPNPNWKKWKLVQRWWSPKSISFEYKKHISKSQNAKWSKFINDDLIETIEKLVFDKWLWHIDKWSPSNRIFLFACFDWTVWKLKGWEYTNIVKIQIDRERWTKWYISKIHWYPISKKELFEDFQIWAARVLDNKIHINNQNE